MKGTFLMHIAGGKEKVGERLSFIKGVVMKAFVRICGVDLYNELRFHFGVSFRLHKKTKKIVNC